MNFRVIATVIAAGAVISAASAVSAAPQPSDQLTLSDALQLALRQNPALAGAAAEIRAKEAAAMQAGLRPNPEISFELDDFAGTDDARRGFDGAEATVSFSRLIELDDKRGKRRQVALFEKDSVQWEQQSSRLDVLAAAAKAFFSVLAAQEEVALNEELVKLAEKSAAAVAERADAGKVSPVDKSRAQVEAAAARSEAAKSRSRLEAARRRLAACWGAEQPEFAKAVGDLDEMVPLPSEERLLRQLEDSPDLARWNSEISRSKAAVALAEAEAVPDLTARAGGRFFKETDSAAFVVSLSIPLPFTNRNQGGIEEARANLEKARHKQRAALAARKAELTAALQALSAAQAEAASLRKEILPGAEAAQEAAVLGYREGKLDFLQMVDAQRTLFQIKRQYLQVLESFHAAAADIERLAAAAPKSLPLEAASENTAKTKEETR